MKLDGISGVMFRGIYFQNPSEKGPLFFLGKTGDNRHGR